MGLSKLDNTNSISNICNICSEELLEDGFCENCQMDDDERDKAVEEMILEERIQESWSDWRNEL